MKPTKGREKYRAQAALPVECDLSEKDTAFFENSLFLWLIGERITFRFGLQRF
ncbi:hypothetical protein [Bacteroides salyersiae]|uniref:hypothetical protein n=1 Tax=Bacteroides salyersiae TaxID=291644 RepID=UPI001E590F5F|nr:hypothetical protein [Bacteroides salyersiae]